jgi:hypothetical protein
MRDFYRGLILSLSKDEAGAARPDYAVCATPIGQLTPVPPRPQ